MKNAKLCSLLLFNLVANTKSLKNILDSNSIEKGEETPFSVISSHEMYSRMLSDIDFKSLSEKDKTALLFLRQDKEDEVDKNDLYYYETQFLTKEAHNRTSAQLGVSKTNVVFCNFQDNKHMNPDDWVLFDGTNGNIYVNLDKDYSKARPSFLLENINAVTRHHSVYQNIFKAIKEPESFSDKELFLVLSTAVKLYVYQDLKENDPMLYSQEIAVDYSTPINIEETIYAFSKTRADFQAAGIYGAKLQEDLRRNEQIYHTYLQDELVTNSLINLEDIFSYFKNSPLNESSNGMMGGLLDFIVKETAYAFYNSVGADMKKGQSITQYIDELEDEMFERCGIEKPSEEELEEFSGSDEYLRQEQIDKYGYSNIPVDCEDEMYEEDGSFEDEEDDEEMPNYKKMDSVLPDEGRIDKIEFLPFHNNAQNNNAEQ